MWDQARAGHVIPGSFGEGVASVQGNVTGSTASVTGNVGGNVNGSVGSVALNGITAASLDASAVNEIVDQTWDETLAAHLTPGSTGEALDTAATAGATDWTVPEREQIRQALGVSGITAPTTGVGTLEVAAATINADTNDIQTKLPATLNNGRMRSHVEACDPPCVPSAGGGDVPCDEFDAVPA